jgi:hypothetical protein
MSPFTRLPLCAVVSVVLFSTTTFLLAKLGGQNVEENLDLLRWASKIGDEMRRHEALEARSAPIVRCNYEKHRLVQELIAHRLTLREVLEQFRELNKAVIEADPNKDLQTALDEASLRHNLLIWVRKELAYQPSVEVEVERKLAELPPSQQ